MLRRRFSELRRDQNGSAAIAIGFGIFATIVMSALVLSVVGIIHTNSFVSSDAALAQAIDLRLNDFEAAYNSTVSTPDETEKCYDSTGVHACATITNLTTTNSVTIVTVSARWEGEQRTLVEKKTIPTVATSSSFITGYDTSGNPIWASEPPATVARHTNVTTLAGSGTSGATNDTGTKASFNSPSGVAVDPSGDVFVADTASHLVREISPAGVVSTLAGTGSAGSTDGRADKATFGAPSGVAVFVSGTTETVYVTDSVSDTIRAINVSGTVSVSTLAGNAGVSGSANGTGTAATFNSPQGIVVDSSGTLYVADKGNNRIRRVTSAGVVSTLAGTGAAGETDTTGSSATFNGPTGLALSGSLLLVADAAGNEIRSVTTPSTGIGVVTTLAGAGGAAGSSDGSKSTAKFSGPSGIAVGLDGTLYVADSGNNEIRAVDASGNVTTFAGSTTAGNVNGATAAGVASGATPAASFHTPSGIVFDASGAIYIADAANNLVRKIS